MLPVRTVNGVAPDGQRHHDHRERDEHQGDGRGNDDTADRTVVEQARGRAGGSAGVVASIRQYMSMVPGTMEFCHEEVTATTE